MHIRLNFILTLVGIIIFFVISSILFLRGTNSSEHPTTIQRARKSYCELLGGEMKVGICGIAACSQKCSFSEAQEVSLPDY